MSLKKTPRILPVSLSIVVFVSTFVTLIAHAAGPVTHLYYGVLWLDASQKHYSDEYRRSFLLGTVFPDIRYIAQVPRESTHVHNVTLKAIAEAPTAFEAGILLHCFVDDYRMQHLEPILLPSLKQYPLSHYLLKILEDHAFFDDFVKKLQPITIAGLFGSNHPEEISQFPDTMVTKWHTELTNYSEQKPRALLKKIIDDHTAFFGIKPHVAQTWYNKWDILNNIDFKHYISQSEHAFRDLFTQFWQSGSRDLAQEL